MNFLQKILGNRRINGEIISGRHGGYYLSFKKTNFDWYQPRGIWMDGKADFIFHTDRFEDLQIVQVMPSGLGGKNLTAQSLIEIFVILNEEKQPAWEARKVEPVMRDDELLGIYFRGRIVSDQQKQIFQELLIPVTSLEKNDTFIFLTSIMPVNAPDELLEEVKEIFTGIKFPKGE